MLPIRHQSVCVGKPPWPRAQGRPLIEHELEVSLLCSRRCVGESIGEVELVADDLEHFVEACTEQLVKTLDGDVPLLCLPELGNMCPLRVVLIAVVLVLVLVLVFILFFIVFITDLHVWLTVTAPTAVIDLSW